MTIVSCFRVRTVDQSIDRQLNGIQLDRVFTDMVSGKSLDRSKLKLLKEYVRSGDTAVIHSMDRLARNFLYLQSFVDEMISLGRAKEEVAKTFERLSGGESQTIRLVKVYNTIAKFDFTHVLL